MLIKKNLNLEFSNLKYFYLKFSNLKFSNLKFSNIDINIVNPARIFLMDFPKRLLAINFDQLFCLFGNGFGSENKSRLIGVVNVIGFH